MTARRMRIPVVTALALAVAACGDAQRGTERGDAQAPGIDFVRTSRLVPGGGPGGGIDRRNPFTGDATAIAEGERLYDWYNCSGCHAGGGGGMGPALMDEKWIYGSRPSNLYDSIVSGRPNGMPSFGAHIPETQVWQIVAYIESLGGVPRGDDGQSPARQGDAQ